MFFKVCHIVRFWRRIMASSSSTVASVVVILATLRPAMQEDTAWETLFTMFAGLSDQRSQGCIRAVLNRL
jgi:hypothetical protein